MKVGTGLLVGEMEPRTCCIATMKCQGVVVRAEDGTCLTKMYSSYLAPETA